MSQVTQPISTLRQRMIEDMQLRKLSPKTQSAYILAVKKLAAYLGHSPHTATREHLLLRAKENEPINEKGAIESVTPSTDESTALVQATFMCPGCHSPMMIIGIFAHTQQARTPPERLNE